jgi:hypothetical protein
VVKSGGNLGEQSLDFRHEGGGEVCDCVVDAVGFWDLLGWAHLDVLIWWRQVGVLRGPRIGQFLVPSPRGRYFGGVFRLGEGGRVGGGCGRWASLSWGLGSRRGKLGCRCGGS